MAGHASGDGRDFGVKPRRQRDDIAAELTEDLRAEQAERERKLGRARYEEEIEVWLRERGRPLVLAGKYRPQQEMIGGALMPVYKNPRHKPRLESLLEMLICLVLMIWLAGHAHAATMLGARVEFAPAWSVVRWLWMAAMLASVAAAGTRVGSPWWTERGAWLRLVTDAVGGAGVCWMIHAGLIVSLAAPGMEAARAATMTELIQQRAMHWFPYLVVGTVLALGLADGGRLWRIRGRRGPNATNHMVAA